MKKHLLIATGLAVLSTSAYATKARMDALGQDERGSFYLEDTRNVFRNASAVNQFKNYVITEWGTAANTDDSSTAPHAEGGFFKESGSMVYGLYMGSEIGTGNNTDSDLAAAGTTSRSGQTFQEQDNTLNLFIAGDAGVEWGARIKYASNNDEQSQAHKLKQSAMGVGLGVTMGDLGAFANLDLSDKSEGGAASADKWEADLGLNVGVTYSMGDMTVFAEYNKTGFEETISSVKKERADNSMSVGVARVHDVASGSRWFYDLRYTSSTNETKAGGTTTEQKDTRLPVTVGFEADATKWLTLRGSISQAVIINSNENSAKKKASNTNTTDVAAGATLNFGKLKVDGTIGTANATGNETGNLRLDDLMSRVAVHYWF